MNLGANQGLQGKNHKQGRTLLRYALGATLILGLSACSHTSPGSVEDIPSAAAVVNINKSPNDPRDYRYLTLGNGLRALLVSDPKTDKAAASLVALRGSFHEPKKYLGLAHFLEHMLFIGTKKYPEVNAYQTYINAHGGSSNAYTALDHTNYFFDIQPEYFRGAMDRFAQFFIAPLLDPAYVDREKNAVHSEYQLQTKNDGWRGYLTQKLALNPEHPGSRFTIGSLDTLGEGVYPALQTFFQENYSADQMILVAFGNEDLDEMESWITPIFDQIENRKLGPAAPLPQAFTKGALPNTIKLQALKDKTRIDFTFPVPNTTKYYREKPLLYITNLLGHEGSNSLHKKLKDNGWIESLSASSDELDNNNTMMVVRIGLTKAGERNIPKITDALFDYIELLRSKPPAQWLYNEQAEVLKLAFQFQEQGSATGFVYRTGPQLAHYPPQDILRAPYRMDKFDAKLIQRYLGYLTPENLLREISGPGFEGNEVEPWFGVSYTMTPGPVGREEAGITGLDLPAPNPFLPENTDVLDNDSQGPAKHIAKPGLELWHDLDTEFRIPRANLLLSLGIKDGLSTPQDIVMAQLYQALANDALNDYTYPAFLAGLGYSLDTSARGFEIRLQGYNNKQADLLERILQTFTNLTLDPQQFEVRRAQLQNNWRSARTEQPYRQTSTAINHLLVDSAWSPGLLADTIDGVNIEGLARWQEQRMQSFAVQGLAHGNLNAKNVTQVADILNQQLPLENFELFRSEVAETHRATRLPLSIDHQDASMVMYLQDPDDKLATNAQSALAVHLMRQPYFTSLRTEQQLGYVVGVGHKTLRNRGGISFVVQSPVANPKQLQQATYDFVEGYAKELSDMSEADYLEYRDGLISELTEYDKNLAQRSSRYWGNLRLGYTTFDRSQQLSDAIKQISHAQSIGYINALRGRLPKERLIAYSLGKFKDAPAEGESIDDVPAYKKRLLQSGR